MAYLLFEPRLKSGISWESAANMTLANLTLSTPSRPAPDVGVCTTATLRPKPETLNPFIGRFVAHRRVVQATLGDWGFEVSSAELKFLLAFLYI